jgi:hypothetical protein
MPASGKRASRRPEFKVTSCILDPDEILRVIGTVPVEVAILNADNPRDGWPDMTDSREFTMCREGTWLNDSITNCICSLLAQTCQGCTLWMHLHSRREVC